MLAGLFIYRLSDLLDITGLLLSTSELTELNTMIAGVLFNFSSLSTVGVDNRSFQSFPEKLKPESLLLH